MKVWVRRRLRRAMVILGTLAVAAAVLTTLERRRVESTATSPAAAAQPAPLDGRAMLADVERLASRELEGRRTGTRGSELAQQFIIERFRAAGAHPAFGSDYRQAFSFTHHSIKGLVLPGRPYATEYPRAANVGAVIRGTSRPERFLALTAHYDSFGIRDGELFPGADDNASGVSVMLAVARALSEKPLGHSVLLLAFDAEEIGIRGARYFVEHPTVDLSRLDVMVNLDMVGRGDENVLVASGTSHYPSLEPPVRAAAAARAIRVVFGHDRPLYKGGLVEDWTGSSDHAPFHSAGIPYVYLGVEDHADYHRASDTADKITARFLGEVAALVADLVRRLDATPPRAD